MLKLCTVPGSAGDGIGGLAAATVACISWGLSPKLLLPVKRDKLQDHEPC